MNHLLLLNTKSQNLFMKLILLSLLLLVSSCSNESDYSGFDKSIKTETANKFFLFFNQQSQLSAGFYRIVVATNTSGSSLPFVLTIEKNNGEAKKVISDNWSNSFGASVTPSNTCAGDPQNYCIDLTMQDESGVTITLESEADNILYLVNKHDSVTVLKAQNESGVGVKEVIEYSPSQIRETAYSKAYYEAVDVNSNRETLQNYLTLHGFGGSDEVHVTFRDTKDLGYGRDMYMRSYHSADCGGQQVTAFYVRNFKVDIIDGLAYGKVNLDAAVKGDLDYHFGSNAIEFSRGFDSLGETCSAEPYNRFFTYLSDYSTPSALHHRLDQIDLDGRGEKAMPQPCISCHGGKARPLDRFNQFVTINLNDSLTQIGDTKSRLQAFEVDTFEFSNIKDNTRADIEEGLRLLNSAVFCTYAGSAGHAACTDFGGGEPAQTDDGEWNADFARDVLSGAYDHKLEVENTQYAKGYVPDGWKPSVIDNIPEGADTLFVDVISPNCFVCHGKRGSSLGSDRNANGEGKDIDFSSWGKFISHSEEIKRLVFQEGRMPLGLLNYNNFWNDPSKASLLASFITPYVDDMTEHVDSNSNIIKPGNPMARAGIDRITKPNAAITLNASSSLFNDTYLWEVISSPIGSNPTLSSTSDSLISFETNIDGNYEIELTVENNTTLKSDTDSINILVDSTLVKNPRDLTFYNDISTELNNCAVQCHSSTATEIFNGIPVWWVTDANQPITPPTTINDDPALGFYEQVRARINLSNIEDSLILKKPTNTHHFGGLRTGFDTSENVGSPMRTAYDLFVNWIYEGTVCGGTQTQCPSEQ